ncbi:FecCD family ABC transporter permease [Alkalihalobacterium elongatum]|uniref:FecCD family ABC transporter permease n=1 Tax=Alkalihalobacterium elongatum TaxID=2675466 RepID=UPI001C1FB2F4|nr:iron ABC transporter permease [Alkalihalobacterium elongatum]
MKGIINTTSARIITLIGLLVLLLFISVQSLLLGLTSINLEMVIQSFTAYDQSTEHIVIHTTRIPRTLIALCIGFSLAIAGVLMQTLTRNPLASPGIFGINAGASFFIVSFITFIGVTSLTQMVWVGFLGAAVATVLVLMIGGGLNNNTVSPFRIVLAGAAITAFFSSMTQGILSLNMKTLDEVMFWLAGSIEGRSLDLLIAVLPYMVIGWFLALIISTKLNTFALGSDIAKGLGQRTGLLYFTVSVVVVLLAGTSVAVAGPIGFIGLIVPHLARYLVGNDHRWVIPFAGVMGTIVLLIADILARLVILPKEVPVGVMTAFIGVPFFIYVIRKEYANKL